MAEIPRLLVDNVRDGNVVLLLGSGATKGACHPKNHSPPDGSQLADLLAGRFLEPTLRGRSLDEVASLAVSESDLNTVQEFVAEIFRPFTPADFHLLLPTFRWASIATTNYDLIVERAYDAVPGRLQDLVPFVKNGEPVEQRLRNNGVAYLKLHGCVTRTTDTEIPLILTPEQYITHRENRSRLFERLAGQAHELPLLIVGNSLHDYDLRQLLLELSPIHERRPRSYLVAPNCTDPEQRYWESRKITVIRTTFRDLITQLDAAIPRALRGLAAVKTPVSHPIAARLRLPLDYSLPQTILRYLETCADFVHNRMPTGASSPRLFYKGHFEGWPEILANLDVKRAVTDTLLQEVVLPGEDERRNRQELVVLKGHAGSGKTVTLHRAAFQAATELDALCLVGRQTDPAEYDVLREIQRLAGCRLFLFLDPATEWKDTILSLMAQARRDQVPLTIVCAERYNAWNVHCEALDACATHTYELTYLNEEEIDELIALLTRHRSLGFMEHLGLEECRAALAARAGRHLLVALHEATQGKVFSDIVLDEYSSIADVRAQTLYRTVCVLHRLGAPPRAGLISRVHGIPLEEFREKLFRPLEDVVFAKKPMGATDFVYKARHQHIADMVFERVLTSATDRVAEYLRIIDALDVDFDADRSALRELANAKELGRLFSDPSMSRAVFAAGRARDPHNPGLLHQEALFEMHLNAFEKASDLLQAALAMRPNNRAVMHTLAELSLRRSSHGRNDAEKDRLRGQARRLAHDLARRNPADSHALHTLLKIGLDEVVESVGAADGAEFPQRVREFEMLLAEAKQRHPNDSFILDADAKFAELLKRHPAALAALTRAFHSNRHSTYIASRLAALLEQSGDKTEAVEVLKEALDASPNDKDLHFRRARLLDDEDPANHAEILYHLKHSFVLNDTRWEAQFWYARAEYLFGEPRNADDTFRSLAECEADHREKTARRGPVPGRVFYGMVDRREVTYCFVRREKDGAPVFARPSDAVADTWPSLRRGNRVSFSLTFNYYGAVACEMRLVL